MNIADLITLAKAGYTPAQVKELMTLDNTTASEPDKGKPEGPQGQTTNNEQVAPPEPKGVSENAAEPEKAEDDGVDYKALYEQSQLALKKAQEANLSKPAQTQPDTSEDDLKNIFRSYV